MAYTTTREKIMQYKQERGEKKPDSLQKTLDALCGFQNYSRVDLLTEYKRIRKGNHE